VLALLLGPQGLDLRFHHEKHEAMPEKTLKQQVLLPAVLEKMVQQPAAKLAAQQLAVTLIPQLPQQLAAKLTLQQLACMMTGLGHGKLCSLLPASMNLHATTWPVLMTALHPQAIAVSLAHDVARQRPPTNGKVAFMALLAPVAQSLMRIRKESLERFIRKSMPLRATVQ